MIYVMGEKNYENRICKLVEFFISARALRKKTKLGINNSKNKFDEAAIITSNPI